MKEKHESMTKQYLIKKPRGQGLHKSPIKEEVFLPGDKMVYKSIKDSTSNSIKVSSRWMKKNIRKEILNYYYSVENGTCLCDKYRIL